MSEYPRMTQTGIQHGPPVPTPMHKRGKRMCEDLCVFYSRCMELCAVGDLLRCEGLFDDEENYDRT